MQLEKLKRNLAQLRCRPIKSDWVTPMPPPLLPEISCAARVDTVGSDPVGSNTVGSDPVGSNIVGSDPIGKVTSHGIIRFSPSAESTATSSRAPASELRCTTAAEYVQSNPQLSTFAELLKASNTYESVVNSTTEKSMVFAPNNQAWQSAATGLNLTQSTLTLDPKLLQAIIGFHIIPQLALPTSQWPVGGALLPTASPGESLEVMPPSSLGSPGFSIGGAQGYAQPQVLTANIKACESLVFIVNAVAISSESDYLLTSKGLVASG